MKQLLLFVLLLSGVTAFSQGTVTGTITDDELGSGLPSATVIEAGTSNGTVTDFDGNFSLAVSSNSGAIEISYLGFVTKTVTYTLTNGTTNLGSVVMEADANTLSEVVIVGSGIIDVAEGRKTPVAVSTITAQEIQLKAAGNVEFTESFKNTPSVYVANQVGGFGDSQVFLRGFDDTNTAFLLNGQPINSQEDGRMFWSNWSGMSDVANAVQVQRGLGASKLAISSVGGTVNIISKTTEKKAGGYVRILGGNDSYFKGTLNYNTGLSDSGWAFSALLDYWQGYRDWAIGTQGAGQTYMFSVGYKPNEKHTFNFLLTGAPQYHDQNFGQSEETYEALGRKYNPNSGFLDGERFTERRNYYHKPVANLNWDFAISDKTELSTVVYASWGRGGGTGGLGRGRVRLDTYDGPLDNVREEIDFEQIRTNNRALDGGVGSFGDSYIRRASVNNHNWYGLLSNLSFDVNDNWDLSVGVDGRLYRGDHFRQVNDLLGLTAFNDNFRTDRPDDYVFTEEFEADPWASLFNFADEDNRTQFDYSENINYVGGFGQAEYATDKFSAFFQGALSTQSFQRTGRFTGEEIDGVDGLGESEKLSKVGYNVKGGASFNITEEHAIFGNAGYFSRQPYLDNIFQDIRNSNALVSPEVENEEILGFEGGYRFQNSNLRLNIDIYRTEWGNRFSTSGGSFVDNDGIEVFFTDRFTDVTQIHQGLEFDLEFRPDSRAYRLRAYGSIGNWKFDGETPFTRQDNETLEFIQLADDSVDLSGVKVGRAPQTSFGAGIDVKITKALSFDMDFNIYTDLYAQVDVDDVIETAQDGGRFQAKRLPAYTLGDAGLTYKFTFGGNKLTFRANVNNVFDEEYFSRENNFGVNVGTGTTYNGSVRYNF